MSREHGKPLALCGLVTLMSLVSARPALAWHGPGHQRATRMAIGAVPEDVPAFFREGAATVAHCSIDPDAFKKPFAGEALHKAEYPHHYFDWERLDGMDIPRTRYELLLWCGREEIDPDDIGLVPYAIEEWTGKLTVALAEHRKWPANPHIRRKALVYAGILAHYAQDLCMPLHTTIHYDGRVGEDGESPRTGIHLKVDNLIQKLPDECVQAIEAEAVGAYEDVWIGTISEMRDSHELVDRVYELEGEFPELGKPIESKNVRAFTAERLHAAAMFTSRLYATAWADSADVEIPDWHTRVDGAAPASVPTDGRLIAAARDDELPPTGEGVVRIATYNVEHMNKMFDQHLLPERSRERTEMWRDEEDQYEVAQVLKLMDADIVGLQECCGREMLEAFNERWLGGMYEFVHVFPSNTEGQWLGMLAKPGFKPVEVREAYLKLSGE